MRSDGLPCLLCPSSV